MPRLCPDQKEVTEHTEPEPTGHCKQELSMGGTDHGSISAKRTTPETTGNVWCDVLVC